MDLDQMEAARSGCYTRKSKFSDAQIDDYLLESVTAGKNNVLHIAGKSGNNAFVEELASNVSPSTLRNLLLQPNIRGDTPIHCAAYAGNADFVKFVVAEIDDVGIEKKNNHGDTALGLAVTGSSGGHLEVVKILVGRHERLGLERNGSDEFPVYLAAERGSLEVLNYLLQFPHFPATGPKGKTALHAAVARRSDGYLKLLLKERPELLVKEDADGSTPLHYLASCGDQRMTNILLSHGDLLFKTTHPTIESMENGTSHKTITTHVAHICDKTGMSPIHVAAAMGHIQVIKEILNSRPDAYELVDKRGRSFLHLAVKHKRTDVLRFVISTDWLKDVLNQQDEEGNTPLHLAVWYHHLGIVKILLKEKEVVGLARNFSGLTPLDLAAADFRSSKMEHRMFEIIKRLIYSRAEFSARRLDLLEDNIKKQQEQEEEEAARCRSIADSLTIVSVLIATVTFAAAFTLPGGYTDAGTAILSNRASFKTFLITNTLAMVTSMVVTYLLVQTRSQDHDIRLQSINTSQGLMKISIGTMAIAFGTATYLVVNPTSPWLSKLVIAMACSVPLALFWIKTWPLWYRKLMKRSRVFVGKIWKILKVTDSREIRVGRWKPSFKVVRERISLHEKIKQWKPNSMTYFRTPDAAAATSYESGFPVELQTFGRLEKMECDDESGNRRISLILKK